MARRSAVREISQFSCGLPLANFEAERAETHIEGIGGLPDAVLDFGLVIRAEEILLLPLVGFLADVEDLCRDDVTRLRAAPVDVFGMKEL